MKGLVICLFIAAATALIIPQNNLEKDVSVVVTKYLPPAEDSSTEAAVGVKNAEDTKVPQDTAVLGEDGYQYKTVRRLKYRHRRDVSELVAPEYLPPSEDASTEANVEARIAVDTEVPEDTALLGENGYQYKTIRRLKYRHRSDVSELVAPEYLPPSEDASTEAAVKVGIAVDTESPEDTALLGEDGYQYKTIRRPKYRNRRDVSELVAPEYLPPVEDASTESAAEAKIAVDRETPEDTAVLGEDGYQYKTVRRLKYRHRRDVSELVAPEYLPPSEDASTEANVEARIAVDTEVPEDTALLGENGYQYKTIRRLKYRHRRDVTELVAPEYLPPSEDASTEAAVKVGIAVNTESPEDTALLGEDGYQYKTIRRLKYRNRRDVSELVAPEYLPPVEDASTESAAEAKIAVDRETPEDTAVLGEDGYQYKTIHRLKYRNRRDVSELVAPEYLPPVEDASTESAAEAKIAVDRETPEDTAVLGEDGYQYKTIRRLKYRNRRDVSELFAPEFLPPAKDASTEAAAEAQIAVDTETPQDTAILGKDGYQYKTIRRLKYRNRRDVSELVAPEYLPPAEEASTEAAVEVRMAGETEAPQDTAILGDDGYQYQTIRRLKYRHRRDVSELLTPEYLPPIEVASTDAPLEVKIAEDTKAPEHTAVLGEEGYKYKTIRRLKYRHRRDVSELLTPEYLPPVEDASTEADVEARIPGDTEDPQDAYILGKDGYQYQTIRRLKYRHRRDIY